MKCRYSPLSLALLLSSLLSISLWLLFHSPVVVAVNSKIAPDLPGSISGRVVDRNNNPIAGVRIEAMRSSSDAYQYAISDENGFYKLLGLGAGLYRVRFDDRDWRYADQFYAGKRTFQEATLLPVAGNHLTGINAILRTGVITGKIKLLTETVSPDLLSPPPDTIRHEIFTHKQMPGSNGWELVSVAYATGLTSVYTLTGLATDQYVICANTRFFYLTNNRTEYVASECYDNVAAPSVGKQIAVVEDETVSNIDFVMGDGVDYAQISGRVTTDAGEPISGTLVAINTSAQDTFDPIFTRTTDANGYYTATIASQLYTYTVYFVDLQRRYVNEYYSDALYRSEAKRITPSARQVITNVSAQLAPAAVITGIVTAFGEKPSSEWMIDVYHKVGAEWRIFRQEWLKSRGQYEIQGLPAGTFRICAIFPYITSGCFGSSEVETATAVTLSQGEVLSNLNFDANFDFSPQRISGFVRGEERPLANIRVELYDLSNLLVYTHTNRSGYYQLSGLSESSNYAVLFKDESEQFATAYYSPHGPADTPWWIEMYSPTVVNNVSIQLQPAGSITGVVQLNTGEPLSDALVSLYWYNEQAEQFYSSLLLRTYTDRLGNYNIKRVSPGTYRVQFGSNINNPFGHYSYEFYGAKSRRNDVNDGQDVFVLPKQVTGGINHIFGADYLIFLPILRR